MRSRLLSVASALALTVAGALLALGPAGPANAHCAGHAPGPDQYTAGGYQFLNGTPINTYPHDGCTTLGLGYPSHGIDIYCSVNTGGWWVYLRDTTTGVKGWSRLSDLSGSGGVPTC